MEKFTLHITQRTNTTHSLREWRLLHFSPLSGPESAHKGEPTEVTKGPEVAESIDTKTPETLQKSVEENSQNRVEKAQATSDVQRTKVEGAYSQRIEALWNAKKDPIKTDEELTQFNKEHKSEGVVMTVDEQGKAHIDTTQEMQISEMPTDRNGMWEKFGETLATFGQDVITMYQGIQAQLSSHIANNTPLDMKQMVLVHNLTIRVLAQHGIPASMLDAARPQNLQETMAFVSTMLGAKKITHYAGEVVENESSNQKEQSKKTVDTAIREKATGVEESAFADVLHEQQEDALPDEEGDPSDAEEEAKYQEHRSGLQKMTTDISASIVNARNESQLDAALQKIDQIGMYCLECNIPAPAVEAITGTLKATIEMQRDTIRQALELFNDASSRIEMLIGGKKQNVASAKSEMDSLGFLARGAAKMSGSWKGMEESLKVDEESLQNALEAKQELGRFSSDSLPAQERIGGIKTCMKRALKMTDYSAANATLEAGASALDTADSYIRTVAEWVPGGALGTAIADARINPHNGDNARNLTGAIGMTALDLIPIPGLKKVGAIVTKGVRMAASAGARSVEKKIIKKAIVTVGKGAAKYAEKKVTDTAKKVAKGSLNAGLDIAHGTERPEEVAEADAPKKGVGERVIGFVAGEVIDQVRLPGTKSGLGEHGKKLAKAGAETVGKKIRERVSGYGKQVAGKAMEKAEGLATKKVKDTAKDFAQQGIEKTIHADENRETPNENTEDIAQEKSSGDQVLG